MNLNNLTPNGHPIAPIGLVDSVLWFTGLHIKGPLKRQLKSSSVIAHDENNSSMYGPIDSRAVRISSWKCERPRGPLTGCIHHTAEKSATELCNTIDVINCLCTRHKSSYLKWKVKLFLFLFTFGIFWKTLFLSIKVNYFYIIFK